MTYEEWVVCERRRRSLAKESSERIAPGLAVSFLDLFEACVPDGDARYTREAKRDAVWAWLVEEYTFTEAGELRGVNTSRQTVAAWVKETLERLAHAGVVFNPRHRDEDQ